MATSPYYIAVKELECISVVSISDIAISTAVGYDSAQVDGAGEPMHGIAKFDTTSGESATIVTHGEAVGISGAAIAAAGTLLATDASGRLVTAASTNNIVGVALGTTAGADEYFPFMIQAQGVLA